MVLRTSFSISGYNPTNQCLFKNEIVLCLDIHQLLSLEHAAPWKDQQGVHLALLLVPYCSTGWLCSGSVMDDG